MAEPRDRDAEGRDPEHRDREDFDRQWQEIVAGLGPLDVSARDAERMAGAEPAGPDPATADRDEAPAPDGGRGPRDYAVDEDDGDFVPPEPPALGSGNPAIVLSMIGVAGAPAGLLLTAIFWPAAPGVVLAVLVAAFMAGAVGLFFALPRDADRDGPGDDGARV
ncbi:MAG: hypothetical protein QJR09_13875 [Micrococcus sp.]|nr:hypothetical protein [Micrococcus sp.]